MLSYLTWLLFLFTSERIDRVCYLSNSFRNKKEEISRKSLLSVDFGEDGAGGW